MKSILIALLVLTVVLTGHRAFAEEKTASAGLAGPEGGQAEEQTGTPPEEEVLESPEEETPESLHYLLPPEREAWLGYRFFDLDGSRKAAEYEYPYSSVVGGFNIVYTPLPTRWDLGLNWVNPNSWDAGLAFAYKDILKLNYSGWALWHNYNHYGLLGTPALDADPKEDYFADARDNRVYIRLKWPDRAYHVFVDLREYDKEGTIQDRFYQGSEKESISRDIDWITRKLAAGFNGHFGPVELEYSHTIKTFEPHDDVDLRNSFSVGPFPGGTKVLDHSAILQFDENSDTVKIHTDLTGRIVGAATFVTGNRENNNSGAQLDYNRAYADLNFIPLSNLTVAFHYRFNSTNETVPAELGMVGFFGGAGMTLNPIDARSNKADVAVRYSPINALAFKAVYSFENVRRYNVSQWDQPNSIVTEQVYPFQNNLIPAEQNIHKITAGVTSKPARWVDFKGTVDYTYTAEPEYPTSPKNGLRGRFDIDFLPMAVLTGNAHYRFGAEDNDNVAMHSRYDNPGAQAIWTPMTAVSFAVNYDYFRYKVNQDIILTEGQENTNTAGQLEPNLFLPEKRAPYEDQAHVYSLSGTYTFSIPLVVEAEYYQSFSKGSFRINESLLDPTYGLYTGVGLGELADLSVRETGGRVTAKYTLPRGWGVSVTYGINNYHDLKKKPQDWSPLDGSQDGTAQTVTILATKKW